MLQEILEASKNLLAIEAPTADLRGARNVARLRRDLAAEHGDPDAQAWRVVALHLGQQLDAAGEA